MFKSWDKDCLGIEGFSCSTAADTQTPSLIEWAVKRFWVSSKCELHQHGKRQLPIISPVFRWTKPPLNVNRHIHSKPAVPNSSSRNSIALRADLSSLQLLPLPLAAARAFRFLWEIFCQKSQVPSKSSAPVYAILTSPYRQLQTDLCESQSPQLHSKISDGHSLCNWWPTTCIIWRVIKIVSKAMTWFISKPSF